MFIYQDGNLLRLDSSYTRFLIDDSSARNLETGSYMSSSGFLVLMLGGTQHRLQLDFNTGSSEHAIVVFSSSGQELGYLGFDSAGNIVVSDSPTPWFVQKAEVNWLKDVSIRRSGSNMIISIKTEGQSQAPYLTEVQLISPDGKIVVIEPLLFAWNGTADIVTIDIPSWEGVGWDFVQIQDIRVRWTESEEVRLRKGEWPLTQMENEIALGMVGWETLTARVEFDVFDGVQREILLDESSNLIPRAFVILHRNYTLEDVTFEEESWIDNRRRLGLMTILLNVFTPTPDALQAEMDDPSWNGRMQDQLCALESALCNVQVELTGIRTGGDADWVLPVTTGTVLAYIENVSSSDWDLESIALYFISCTTILWFLCFGPGLLNQCANSKASFLPVFRVLLCVLDFGLAVIFTIKLIEESRDLAYLCIAALGTTFILGFIHLLLRFDSWSHYSWRSVMSLLLVLSGGDLVVLQIMSSRIYKIFIEHHHVLSVEIWIAMLITAIIQDLSLFFIQLAYYTDSDSSADIVLWTSACATFTCLLLIVVDTIVCLMEYKPDIVESVLKKGQTMAESYDDLRQLKEIYVGNVLGFKYITSVDNEIVVTEISRYSPWQTEAALQLYDILVYINGKPVNQVMLENARNTMLQLTVRRKKRRPEYPQKPTPQSGSPRFFSTDKPDYFDFDEELSVDSIPASPGGDQLPPSFGKSSALVDHEVITHTEDEFEEVVSYRREPKYYEDNFEDEHVDEVKKIRRVVSTHYVYRAGDDDIAHVVPDPEFSSVRSPGEDWAYVSGSEMKRKIKKKRTSYRREYSRQRHRYDDRELDSVYEGIDNRYRPFYSEEVVE